MYKRLLNSKGGDEVINMDLLTMGLKSTIHHLFLVMYSNNMSEEVLTITMELQTRYPMLEVPISNIGYKGVNISSIRGKALNDLNSGEYKTMLQYYDSSSTVSFFNNLNRITDMLKNYTI